MATDYDESPSKTVLIGDMPQHERPRERLWRLGASSLKDEELLAIILRIGPPGMSAIDLARHLLHRYDHSLGSLSQASPSDLTELPGIGHAKAAELKATFALAERMAKASFPERAKLDSPEKAANYLRELFRDKVQEEMHVVLLDTKNRFIRQQRITQGLLDRSAVHAREVFRPAIQYSAAKLILAHNHPSGDSTPSTQDIACTKTLVQAGKIIGIEVVDHLVIGTRKDADSTDFFSFREHDMM